MKRFNKYFEFILLLLTQLLIEQSLRYLSGSEAIIINWSVVFLANILLFFFFRKRFIFYILQFVSIITYCVVIVPHYYYFNIFSFFKRLNYILISPEKFIIPFFFSLTGALILFGVFWIQYTLIKKSSKNFYFLPLFVVFMAFFEVFFSPFHILKNRVVFSYVGSNYITSIISDYDKYQKGKREITNYSCNEEIDQVNNELSPTIKYLNNNDSKKDFLILMESWGEMKNSQAQSKLMNYIQSLFFNHDNLSSMYNIKFGHTCFHGNTSAAEGRELLNMNDEESYRAFLNFDVKPQYNIIKNKKDNGYHTIAGFSASKQYGSNYSNAEGFRNALNFDSKIYYETLKKSYKTNYENNYNAVYDESLIDSIINESKLYKKVFAYALTINTHTPFVLDKDNIKNKENYIKAKVDFLEVFKQNDSAFDQFYRISSIIDHTFKRIMEEGNNFDRILIVGDHANPDFNSRNLYNDSLVPYIYLERKSIR